MVTAVAFAGAWFVSAIIDRTYFFWLQQHKEYFAVIFNELYVRHTHLPLPFFSVYHGFHKKQFRYYLYFTASSGLSRAARRAGHKPVIKPTNVENPAMVTANHKGV